MLDYAAASLRDHWLHHYAIGDPSWDTFVREPGNPIYQGRPPYEWPVNGFLFRDPPSGCWYAYVGLYPKGYWPGGPCLVMRERRAGGWEECGLAIQGDAAMFDGDGVHPGAMPDVSVVYADGRYHMVYDWANNANTRGGIAYAWAERPEGPFHRAPSPIHEDTFQQPILGCYVRTYAATLIQRAHDWLILHDMSTPGNAGGTWAMACMTAARPEGPYSSPTLLLYPQSGSYLPPYMEYYPAFTHEGHVYAPATSVALNRNYQCLFRALLEHAHEPGAWELAQHGSVWHAEGNPSEAQGIWGQTFSAQVSPEGLMRIYFTSKTRADVGTVHLAHRPWQQPYHDGFALSAPNAPALAILRANAHTFTCRVRAFANGTWALSWQCRGPLGPDTAGWNPQAHPLMRTQQVTLQLAGATWRLVSMDAHGNACTLDHGTYRSGQETYVEVCQQPHQVTLSLNGLLVSQQCLPALEGRLELRAEAGTLLGVNSFCLTGDLQNGSETLLATEALAGAGTGIHAHDWQPVQDEHFRFGTGFCSVNPVARAKWNYYGGGFKLYAPLSSAYTKARITADGKPVATIDLHAESAEPSRVVYEMALPVGFHAVAIEALGGCIPCDCLEITQP
jgi:hypothetical protein